MINFDLLSQHTQYLIQNVCKEDLKELRENGRVVKEHQGMNPAVFYKNIYTSFKEGNLTTEQLQKHFHISGELVNAILRENNL